MCQTKKSAQRLIFDFYELITVTEMKGALIVNYAYRYYSEGAYLHLSFD